MLACLARELIREMKELKDHENELKELIKEMKTELEESRKMQKTLIDIMSSIPILKVRETMLKGEEMEKIKM